VVIVPPGWRAPFFIFMRKLRWQLLVVVLALAAIAILLLGQQPVTPPLTPGTADPESTPEPETGGSYIEGLVGSLGRLNPLLDYYNSADHDVNHLIFSGMVRFDDRGLPLGDLAEAWAISQDGTAYSFSIRPNAVWHDGEPVVADDILFTLELMQDPAVPIPEDLRQFWQQVEVQVLDEKTIHFKLPEAFAPFMDYLTFGVLPVHLLAEVDPSALVDDPFNLQPVGSGPFRFERLLVEDGQIAGVYLVANDAYYNGRPYLDEVIFRYYPTPAAALQAFTAGEVTGLSQITADILEQALSLPELAVYSARLPRQTMIFFNHKTTDLPFLQDEAVRRALLLGLNRQWIVDQFLNGQGIVSHGPVLPGTWAYFDGIEQMEYDPEGAVAMLRESGYTIPGAGGDVRANEDGVYLRFELVYPDEGAYPQIAQAVRQNWQRLGVEVTLKGVPPQALLDDYLQPRTYQAALVDLNLSRSPDPDPYPFWHQTQAQSGQNYAQWDDRQASEYLEQARITSNLDERARAYRNFQVRFTHEMPALPLFHPVFSFGVEARIQGARMGPLFDTSGRLNTITIWHIEPGRTAARP
jgi:peptide/nickel transport system substrate-binding protein